MAERQGFEPWKGYSPLLVFKTSAFNRSAISPFEGGIIPDSFLSSSSLK